ncbi:unnamed protein product [Bursaphelenchus okinawaensis]|uniref:Uncharacterized protein n=1 Tax=Bursaphelenchus okinawaensis TaxID=465554 RepID=A0A811KY81_9BILA|nr:unnamed protein product [Bursaphelenchus okinawaensis]CAG9113787.1 unnamed protein product [Bursaphelenchus okinawaensis]
MKYETPTLLLITFTSALIDVASAVLAPHVGMKFYFMVLVVISLATFVASRLQSNGLNILRIVSVVRVINDGLILNGVAYLVAEHVHGTVIFTTQLWILGSLVCASLLLHILKVVYIGLVATSNAKATGEDVEQKQVQTTKSPYGVMA